MQEHLMQVDLDLLPRYEHIDTLGLRKKYIQNKY